MGTVVKPNTFTNGTTADGTQVNANFDTIYNDYNGNITDVNIAASGITTYGKVNGGALSSLGSIASGAGTIPSKNGGTGADLSASAQGAVPYFSATGVISALTAGTLGYYLKAGGASANPSWAIMPHKVGTFDRTLTAGDGNVAYTGVGFTPRIVIFFAYFSPGNTAGFMGIGVDDLSATQKNIHLYPYSTSVCAAAKNDTYSIGIQTDSSTVALAKVASFDADGFTLAWSKIGSPSGTGTILYVALG